MRVLVTGSAGLVGHAVRRRLEAAGAEVVPVDVDRWSFDGVEQLPCDLLDRAAVDRVVEAERPAVVVHAGGASGPMVLADDPVRVVEVNVGGTAAVLEAARRHGVARVVFCSSIAAYGRTPERRVVEETPLHPGDVYGATKAAGEQLAEAYRHRHGLSTASLRLVAVFGPRRRTDCLIRDLLLDAAAGRTTRVRVPADAPQQFVAVDDAADAVVAAVHAPDAVGAYNVAGDRARIAAELVAAVAEVEPRVRVELDPPDPSASARWPGVLDVSAAERELGWVPRADFGAAVAAYRDWLAARS
ncbi:NAD-dependent epimerase/dehydratase family protein [Actinomycetospora sp. C-140]